MSRAVPDELRLDPQMRQIFTHDLRIRALLVLEKTPSSASELAARFDVEVNKMAYHMRALDDAGVLELVEQRIKGPSVERFYRARKRGWASVVKRLNQLAAAEQEDTA